MIIKLDTRESALLLQINNQISNIPIFNSIKIKLETLPIGDIIISDEIEDKIIIERKTVSDLLSSIKDGRYEEQSFRLNGHDNHNHNIIYLIEGDINKVNRFKPNDVEKLTLYSAIFSLNYYKGFSTLRSLSLEESANIICNMAYKIEKEKTKKPYFQNKTQIKTIVNHCNDMNNVNDDKNNDVNIEENNYENNDDNNEDDKTQNITEKDYVCVVKKIKKDNITPDNIGEIMLCQIPGISCVTALAIMGKYKTIPNLIKELETDMETIKNLSYVNSKGQTRKINKTSIDNIIKFMLKK